MSDKSTSDKYMKRLTFIFILTMSYATCCYSQNVDKIIQADTVYFDLKEADCFSYSNTKIVITIISKDKYNINFNDSNITRQSIINRQTLLKFAELYKTKMARKAKYCIGAEYTDFILKSKTGSVSFQFSDCNSKDNPYQAFLKILNVAK